MKPKKQRIILSEELVPLEKVNELIKKDIFPLAIILSNTEYEKFFYKKAPSKYKELGDWYRPSFEPYLVFNSYVLRQKIDRGEVYVDKFITKNHKVKNVNFIIPAYGWDMDSPRIVFKRTPRLFFKTWDHYTKDTVHEGTEILDFSVSLVTEDIRKKR